MTRNALLLALLFTAAVCTSAPAAVDLASNGLRSSISLDGQWQTHPIAGFTFSYPPPADGWTAETVPQEISKAVECPGGPYRVSIREMTTPDGKAFKRQTKIATWFRRTFDGPAGPVAGQRQVLHFEGMAFRTKTWLNGKLLGESVIGEVPQDYDVTAALKYGQPNELVVGVAGREAIVDLATKTYIAPASGVMTGIWGSVALRSVPKTSVDDIFVKTSFRNKQIDLETTVVNASDKPRTVLVEGNVVDDAGEIQCGFLPKPVTVAPGASANVTLTKSWLAPRLWTPDNPIMYVAHVRLRDGGAVVDESTQRFGYREFWIEGRDFYLNGVRTQLRRASMLTAHGGSGPAVEREMRLMAGRPFNSIRLHIGFNNTQLLDAADRFGVMACPELAWYNIGDDYNLADTSLWLPNVLEYERKIMKLHRSRPSVVIWNLTNETFWDDTAPVKMKIADQLLQTAKDMDPTRPQEGDGEINWGGRLPIISIHYPEGTAGSTRTQYPDSGLVLPNDLYWLEQPVDGKVHSWRADFVWDRPLFIGEYWDPSGNIDERTSFMGEEVYDWQKWRFQDFSGRDRTLPNAYAEALHKYTDVYRMQGVAGLNPWAADRQVIMPSLSIRPLTFNPNFYGGQTGSRKVVVFADTDENYYLPQVRTRLTIDGVVVWEKKQGVNVSNGKPGTAVLPIDCPVVDKLTKATLTVRFTRSYGDGSAHDLARYDESIYILPTATLKGVDTAGVVLLDNTGATATALAKIGLTITPKTSLSTADLTGARLLIIGSGVEAAQYRTAIGKFVSGGGRALLLSAANATSISTDIPEVDKKHVSSRVWLRSHGVAALGGLEEPQFSYWLPDNIVSRETLYKPSTGRFKILLDSGGLYGLRWAPLVEVVSGSGKFIVSQLNLIDRIGVEPAADTVLASLIKSSLAPKAPAGQPMRVLIGDNAPLKQAIASAAITTAPAGQSSALTLVDASYTPTAADLDSLQAQLKAGGVVWLHGFSPKTLASVAALFPFTPSLSPIDKTVQSAVRRSDDPWMDSISSFDFAWTRIDIGARNDYFGSGQPTAPIGTFALDQPAWPAAQRLVEPALLWKIPVGKGAILFDTLPWEGAMGPELDKAMRVVTSLTLNIGGDVSVEPAKSYAYKTIDISKQATRAFYDPIAGDGKGGWTDQGENDFRYFLIDHVGKVGNMDVVTGEFPAQATFADRPFALVNPKKNDGRAVITLRGQGHDLASPASVTGIAAGCKADKLWFLQTACWAIENEVHQVLGRYTIRYDDGTTAVFPLREGIELSDWWDPKPLAGSRVGWSGRNPMHAPVGLYVTEWTNPHPDKTIASIDLEGNLAQAQIVLVGITAGVESSAGDAAAPPAAAWDFTNVTGGTIPNTVSGGAPLKFFTWNNPPQPVVLPGAGVRFAHGSSAEGTVKGIPGIGDATPWTLGVDLTIDAKPDGYCGGVFQAMQYLKAGLRLVVSQDLKLTAELYQADGKGRYLTSSAPLTAGRDYKVKVSFDGAKAMLYLNNHLDAVIDSPVPAAYNDGCQIGVAGGKDYNFNGVIRSVSITPLAPTR
ncbi:MAG TPA: glycoside hydrolase family 2 TIM barrel-domain containing protein [Capsulimonadaceae bacterium]|jgi:beta-galactosidase